MAKVRVAGFSVSLDGYGAGPEQSSENPLGKRGMELHEWAFGTKTFRKMTGKAGGSDGVDEDYAARSMTGFGVRRDKAALSSGCKAHPAIRSSRKQSEQSWR